MEDQLPKFDIPEDFIAGDFVTKEMLDFYKVYPCKIKSAIFVVLEDGEIDATINLLKYNIKPNDFILVLPHSFIQIHELRGNIKLHFIAFSSGFMHNINFFSALLDFLPLLIDNPVVHLPDETAIICRDFINVLMRASALPEHLLDKEAHRAILIFLFQQISKYHNNIYKLQQEGLTRDKIILKEFMQILFMNYTKEHRVSYYAKSLGITLQHFCNTIKRVTGKTALDIISGMIIMDAKAQLKATDLSIKEIAVGLGFTNHAFFNKFFKQHTQMTPQEYRKS